MTQRREGKKERTNWTRRSRFTSVLPYSMLRRSNSPDINDERHSARAHTAVVNVEGSNIPTIANAVNQYILTPEKGLGVGEDDGGAASRDAVCGRVSYRRPDP
jgi:hypothetical protein